MVSCELVRRILLRGPRLARSLHNAAHTAKQRAIPYEFSELYSFNHLNLPRLPIPELDQTLDRYVHNLRSVIYDPENLRSHEKNVEIFRKGIGPSLQRKLILEDQHYGYPYTFIEQHWDDMYLELRCPLPIRINPGYSLRDDADEQGVRNAQASRVAKFVISTFRWQKKLMDGLLEADSVPQCMSQLGRLLGTAREAQIGRDVLKFYPDSRHIAVMRHGRFFRVDVVSECWTNMLSQEGLMQQLQFIIDHVPPSAGRDPGVPTLTVQDRDVWARQRDGLGRHSACNAASLQDVDSALLVVCLDHARPPNWNLRSEELLHGSVETVCNRWFDKIQVISCSAGSLSVLFEHSFSDGAAWNRWLGAVLADMQGQGGARLPRLAEVRELSAGHGPKALNFEVPVSLESGVAAARREAEEMTRTCRTAVLRYQAYGAKQIKRWQLSPDGFVQMAMQYAFARLHDHVGPTYESCAMLAFFHGRTDVIRSAHAPAASLVAGLLSGQGRRGGQSLSWSHKEALLREAVAHQVGVSKMCAQGMGVDRHLLALSKIAARDGVVPEMFCDEEFIYTTSTWCMSTSNVSTPWNECFNYGPVNDHCYGIGYLIHDEDLVLNTTTWASSGEVDAAAMADSLRVALDELGALLDHAGQAAFVVPEPLLHHPARVVLEPARA